MFVARFSAAGALTYCSYFGGSSSEMFYSGDIEVDALGRVVFASDTRAATCRSPASARQAIYGGGSYDGFLARIDTSVAGRGGAAVLHLHRRYRRTRRCTGSRVPPTAGSIVAGETASANFPVTAGAYDTTFNTGGFALDGFVAKLRPVAERRASLVYATLLGGSDRESLFDIAVDAQGRAHVVGQSRATDFPLVGAVDSAFFIFESIVSILDPSGSCAGLLDIPVAGRQRQRAPAVAVNADGETYVVGTTNATAVQSPALPNAFPLVNAMQTAYGGGGKDAVLQKLGVSVDLSAHEDRHAGRRAAGPAGDLHPHGDQSQ